jgi:hypothetical protein
MKKKVIITIYEKHLNHLNGIADNLRADGLNIQRLYDYGVIVGEIEEHNLENLMSHKEIESCEKEKKIQLPPPDADIQ